jgi:hypothetical protein
MKHKYLWLIAKVPALPVSPTHSEPRCENHAEVFEVFHVRQLLSVSLTNNFLTGLRTIPQARCPLANKYPRAGFYQIRLMGRLMSILSASLAGQKGLQIGTSGAHVSYT